MRRLWLTAALALAAGLLAACGGAASGPTPQPSNTPTPVSTPLATIMPTLAAGTDGNPIQFVIVSTASGRAAQTAASTLEGVLREATGLGLHVALASSDRDAVAALCAAFDGPPALAFVSAPGYSAAAALGCGLPLLLAQDSELAAREVIVIASQDSRIDDLSDVTGKTFCRLDMTDLATWQAPSLLLLANGIAPTVALREVVDLPDLDTLVEQVAAGDCDVAALYAADFERIADADAQANITRLPQSVSLPPGVVMAAREVPLGARTAIQEALREFARTPEGANVLRPLFGATTMVLPASDSLAGWDAFIARTGLDFAAFDQ